MNSKFKYKMKLSSLSIRFGSMLFNVSLSLSLSSSLSILFLFHSVFNANDVNSMPSSIYKSFFFLLLFFLILHFVMSSHLSDTFTFLLRARAWSHSMEIITYGVKVTVQSKFRGNAFLCILRQFKVKNDQKKKTFNNLRKWRFFFRMLNFRRLVFDKHATTFGYW